MRTILVSAYGCEPNLGSEQGVGWNWVLQMAKNNKLHVITRANNRKKIEGNVPLEVADNITFHYYDTHWVFRKIKKRAKGLYFYYFFWQVGIISVARQIIRNEKPDYTIYLTFGSMWMPTFLHFFKTPFIWGPIGGGDCEPRSFIKILPLSRRFQAYLRLVMNRLIGVNPFIALLCWRASAVLCRTKTSGDILPSRFDRKKYIVLETAIEEMGVFDKNYSDKKTINLISTGRLMPSKNIACAVKALTYLPYRESEIKYTIIGSGPEKNNIEREIKKNKLQETVEMLPEMSRQDVLSRISQSDIFIFPSLREGGSWSLMEAMAMELPVVCLNWSGMQTITDDSCAIRLPVTNPNQMPIDMANAISVLIENPILRKNMGKSGREKITTHFNWNEKGRFMESLFNKLEQDK